MRNDCVGGRQAGTASLLFTAGLTLLVPPLLVIDKFRFFLVLCLIQICLLITVFYMPSIYLAAHMATLFVLTYRVVFRAARMSV